MLILIISFILLVIGIICIIIDSKVYLSPKIFLFGTGVICFFIGAIGLIVSMTLVSRVQFHKDVEYQNKLYEKEMLEYRISKQDNINGNELLYTQIIDFNNDLRYKKKWAANPWTNWFINQDIANKIDYITINDVTILED